MPNSTGRLELVQPIGTDAVSELRVAIAANAATLDPATQYGSGTFTNRTAAATTDGNLYESTDVNSLAYYSTAAGAWTPLLQLTPTATSTNMTAKNGQSVQVIGAGVTITLPTATPGTLVAVWNYSGTGASPTTVASTAIYGQAIVDVTTWLMGAFGQCCIFSANYGGTWVCVSGQYDTGWVTLTTLANWTATSGTPPQVRRVADQVYVRGEVHWSGGSYTAIADLATVFTPTAQQNIGCGDPGALPLIVSGVLYPPVEGATSSGSLCLNGSYWIY